MNNVIDEVLAGNPKYTLTYSDNTTATGVSIELETQVTTQGTPLNKALFDSIQADLDTRLPKADIASTGEATGGTNDTHYMTPLKNQQHYEYNRATQNEATTGTNDTHYITPLTATKTKLGSRFHIATGVVSDNGTIPQTSGYDNYFYFVSPTMDYYCTAQDSGGNEIKGAGFKIECSVNQSTRKVTAKAYSKTIRLNSAGTETTSTSSIKANYIEFAWN